MAILSNKKILLIRDIKMLPFDVIVWAKGCQKTTYKGRK